MKRIIIAAIIASIFTAAAYAQVAPTQPLDQELAMSQQLLKEANDRVITLGARAARAEATVAELKAQIDRRKQEDEAKPVKPKDK